MERNDLHNDNIIMLKIQAFQKNININFMDLYAPFSLVIGGGELPLVSLSYITKQNRSYMKSPDTIKLSVGTTELNRNTKKRQNFKTYFKFFSLILVKV